MRSACKTQRTKEEKNQQQHEENENGINYMIGFEVATIHRYANASGTIVSQATGYEKFANDMK